MCVNVKIQTVLILREKQREQEIKQRIFAEIYQQAIQNAIYSNKI